MRKEKITVGIDLGKRFFHVRAEDEKRRCLLDQKVKRANLMEVVLKLEPSVVGMEAGGGAHHWGRSFESHGVEVRLLPPQYVRPYRRGDKNDANDAEAILETMRRPGLHPIPVKSIAQQSLQLVIRDRESKVACRTQLINEVRAALLEFGYCVNASAARLKVALVELCVELENADLRRYVEEKLTELRRLEEQISALDRRLRNEVKANPVCRRLRQQPGVGPVTAATLVAMISRPERFRNGRQFAAYLGLVPRQYSTGGRTRLRGVAKDGNRYLRQLMIHGARSIVRVAAKRSDPLAVWARKKQQERGFNKACVAVANKNARQLWAIMRQVQIAA